MDGVVGEARSVGRVHHRVAVTNAGALTLPAGTAALRR